MEENFEDRAEDPQIFDAELLSLAAPLRPVATSAFGHRSDGGRLQRGGLPTLSPQHER